jgi:hypothetical protein
MRGEALAALSPPPLDQLPVRRDQHGRARGIPEDEITGARACALNLPAIGADYGGGHVSYPGGLLGTPGLLKKG